MDFDFDEDQKALREAVRDTLAGEVAPEAVIAWGDDERGFTDDFWRQIADLGWVGLLIDEEHGGLGLGLIDMIVLTEEMGRVPLPGPFFSSAVLATLTARAFGATDLLPDLASGARRGTVALDEFGSRDPLEAVRVRATHAGDGWTLDGVKSVVLDGHTADWVLVVAQTDAGPGVFLLEQPDAEPVPSLDPTRKLARLELDATPARRVDDGDDTERTLRRVIDDAGTCLAAESVGAADRALEIAVEYSRQRVQFGRPIGSFQAIRHLAAEMLQRVELARVGVHYAAWTSEQDEPDRERASALAKGWASEAAIGVTGDSIQIHGGVGFTWSCPAHFYFRRAKVNDLLLGQQGWQRQRVADLFIDEVTAATAS